MATQDYPIFEIDATLPELGQRTGVFEMKKATVESGIRTGYLVENQFSGVIGKLGELTNDKKGSRKGITVDTGGGQHYNEVRLESQEGDDGQWGYTSDTNTLNAGSASAGDRIQKIQVFNYYLMHSSPDSLSPARLKYGEYVPNGFMPGDYLDVYVESPSLTRSRDTSSTFTAEIRFISTVDLSNTPATSLERTD